MGEIRIRRLNYEGIRRFGEFIDSQTGATPQQFGEARAWLTSPETSEGISGVATVDPRRVFPRRFDLAEYLYPRVQALTLPDPVRDEGLWAWFALLWFEQLCPKKGSREYPGRLYRYIPELDNYQTYYRHRVLGPYLIYATHSDRPERGMCMLCQPPAKHPDTAESLVSRHDIIQSPSLIGVATLLYFDPERGDVRSGSTSRYKNNLPKPGTVRRLVDVAWQLDRTYDHIACSELSLLSLLPAEFAAFKKRVTP